MEKLSNKPVRYSRIPALLIPLVVLAVLVIVQLISARHHVRMDLSARKLHSLSEKSRNVLSRLEDKPLKVMVFYGEDDYGRQQVHDLLKTYRDVYPDLTFEFVEPSKNPGLVEAYEVGSHGTIVLEYEERRTKVISRQEEDLTNAIFRLIADRRKPVYFLTGHGEKSINSEYSQLREALEGEQYDARNLLLLRAERVPEDASGVVVAGPRDQLVEHETKALRQYLENGGSLLVMLDPLEDGGLTEFLQSNGLGLRQDMIVDNRSKIMGGDYLFPIITDYGSHPIVQALDLASFYPMARSLSLLDQTAGEVETRVLAQTGADAWAEMDHARLAEGKAQYDAGEDIIGPLVIGAVSVRAGQRAEQDGRLVVFGDSDFASDDYLEVSGNRDIILNTLGWLTNEQTLIGIRSREPEHSPIVLTQSQSRLVFWLALVLLPALSAVMGIFVWMYRRWKR